MGDTTKLAGAAGITWAAANVVLGFSTGQPPELDAAGADIAAYLAGSRGLYLAALAVFGATLPLLFMFTGELRRRGDRDRGLAAPMHTPALATMVTGTALAYAVLVPFVLGDGLGADAAGGVLRYAYVLSFVMALIGNVGAAALIVSAGATQSGTARTVSVALGTLVGVLAVGGLVSPGLTMVGGLGFVVVGIWSVVVGIGMVRAPAQMVRPAALAAA